MTLPLFLRSVARARVLTAGVVITVALGVAALTTTFGIANAAIYRQPPFERANELAILQIVRNPRGESTRRERWSYARSQLLRQQQRSFASVANYSLTTVSVTNGADVQLERGEMVHSSYFALLGVRPTLGRALLPADDDIAGVPVIVLSQSIVERRWPGEAPASFVGRPIRVNGLMLTVVGILPAGFRGISGQAEMWMPAPMAAQLTYADYVRTNQNFISVIGRLRPGVTLEEARNELAVLGASINRAQPSDPGNPDERVAATALPLNEARSDATVRRSIYVLFAAVAVLHLLACANVINLLLGRAATKRRESAVRIALGSSPQRLFAHLFGEAAAPATLGSALGVAAAYKASQWIAPPTNVWAARNFYGNIGTFDVPAFGSLELLFGVALAVGTVLLVAVIPALMSFRIDVSQGVKVGSRGVLDGGGSARSLAKWRISPRGAIVAVESALAMLLVVAAGLLIDSFQRMQRTQVGVDTNNVLTFWIIPSEARVPPSAGPAFVSRVLDAVANVPGVIAASVDGGAPMAGTANSTLFIEGRPTPAAGQAPPVLRHYIAPGHFATLGIPIRQGRAFTASDVGGAPKVTIISETAARRFWPNEDPIGKRVWFGGGSSFSSPDSAATIVGIVGDVVYAPVDQQPNRASFYTPYMQFTYASRMVFLRTAVPPMSVVPAVRQALATVDSDLPMRDVRPLSEVVDASWARHRFTAILFGGFGIAALLLAASGIFAVLAYAVSSRTREFGVRIALGASGGTVMGQVLREGMVFPAIGLVLGVAAAMASTRILRASLYEITPLEPAVYVRTALLLLVVAVIACVVPAWRATRADPMEALRAD
jgi:predicted permease